MSRDIVSTRGLVFAILMSATFAKSDVVGQVVQLPSIHTFSYSGSVLVPDSGGAYMGGVSRSASGRSGRGFGSTASHSGASISTTVIDHQAIDDQIRGKQNLVTPDRTEEGKALVRHARLMYRAGNTAASSVSYQMAIQILDGRLKQLAQAEYNRVIPVDRPQALANSR